MRRHARLAAEYGRSGQAEKAREQISAAEQKTGELQPDGRLVPRAAIVAALVAAGEHGRAAGLAAESTSETTTSVHTWLGGRRPYREDEILALRSSALLLSAAGFPDHAARIANPLREEARYFRRFRSERQLAATYRNSTSRGPTSSLRETAPVHFVGGSAFHHASALDLIADSVDGRGGGLAERVRDLQFGQWPSPGFQQSAMVAVVESLVARGELEEAEELARWSMTGEHAAEAQAIIAAAMMAGQPAKSAQLAAGAEATARKAGLSARSEVRAVLAEALAEAGDRHRAERLAPERDLRRDIADVADPLPSGQVQEALGLVAVGAYRRAEHLVCERGEAFPAAEPIAEVAAALVRAGELRRAERLFKRAHLSVDRGRPMAVYAAALAGAGRLREVRRLEKEAFFSEARFQVQVAAAEGFAITGDVRAAAKFAERAGAEARDHSTAKEREARSLLLARVWAAIGDRGRADRLVRDIREPTTRIAVLAVFAAAAARAGDAAGAVAEIVAARAIVDEAGGTGRRTEGLVQLAVVVADCEEVLAGQLTQAGIPSSRRLVAEATDSPGWLSAIPVACKVDLPAVQALADTLISSRPARHLRDR
jgi:hypothetical protein